MTAVNVYAFVHFLCVVIAFTEVACWTYDLDEVRKFFDEQQRREENWNTYAESHSSNQRLMHDYSDYNYGDSQYNHGGYEHRTSYRSHRSLENGDHYPYSFDNHETLMPKDSHNNYGSPNYNHGLNHESSYYNYLNPYRGETRNYAEGYAYESYMGKKLHGIMRNGTRYLEGLRLAVENFKHIVENCTRADASPFPGLRYNGSAPGMEIFNSSSVQGLDSNMQWPEIFNMTAAMMGLNTSNPVQRARDAIPGVQSVDTGRCANATRESEKVRRLADLAMHTVRQLQDLAMKKRHKGDEHVEIELLVRLAWFLEQLAHITGFDPEADRFAPTEGLQQTTTAATQSPLALPVSDQVKQRMMDCLRENSTEPATQRCNIPIDMPPIVRMTLNIPENNEGSPVLSNPEPSPAPASELSPTNPTMPSITRNLMPNNPRSSLPNSSENPSNLTSGSLDGLAIENQMSNLPQFTETPPQLPPLSVIGLPNTNPSEELQTAATNQMSNLAPFSRTVKSIRKRSLNDPMLQVMKYYVKHKLWTGSNTDTENNMDGLNVDNDISTDKSVQKRSIDDINFQPLHKYVNPKYFDAKKDRINTIGYKRLDRKVRALKSIMKRSVKYQDWVATRQSEDPQQDISYYVKNKPGTNVMASSVGVAQARLALERIFQTGNIEVVRRYGANYNPLIPSPFYFGLVKTLADI